LWNRGYTDRVINDSIYGIIVCFEKLKAAGVPEHQAKVQVEALQDIVKSYLVGYACPLPARASLTWRRVCWYPLSTAE
jgi:hypothetical protein